MARHVLVVMVVARRRDRVKLAAGGLVEGLEKQE
jgi:hypothetical protein